MGRVLWRLDLLTMSVWSIVNTQQIWSGSVWSLLKINPNVVDLCREKTHQGASDVVSHSRGQVEAYLTVHEILPEASKGADGGLWCELTVFAGNRFATLEFIFTLLDFD